MTGKGAINTDRAFWFVPNHCSHEWRKIDAEPAGGPEAHGR
jgi:hypothetical protein